MDTPITTISKFAPIDITQDYEALRQKGIQHLEELASYIWTDFNVHDPGITILEVLCYAITDLGYRTTLPIEDHLTGPDGKLGDAFSSAQEVLPICPVTKLDYRKVLIDFPGIRNAWVEKTCADEVKMYLKKVKKEPNLSRETRQFIGDYIIGKFNREQAAISTEIQTFNTLGPGFQDVIAILTEVENDLKSLTTPPQVESVSYYSEGAEEITSKLAGIILPPTNTDPSYDRTQSAQNIQARIDSLTYASTVIRQYETFLTYAACYFISEFRQASADEIQTIRRQYSLPDTIDLSLFDNSSIRTSVETELLNLANDPPTMDILGLLKLINSSFLPTNVGGQFNDPTQHDIQLTQQFVDQLLCQFRYFELLKQDEYDEQGNSNDFDPSNYVEVCPNGLYRICLDTWQPIVPGSKDARRLIERIQKGYVDEITQKEYKGLYSYRNLAEDVYDIQIAPTQEICLCLDISVEADAEEAEVMAEVMFRIQEFLTPAVPFSTLQQLLDEGQTCDEIFNGPLLCNGFIQDKDLQDAVIPDQIRLSDLYKIILETPQVQTIHSLKIRNNEEGEAFVETWCFDYRRDAQTDCPIKPVVNLSCSSLCARKGELTFVLEEADLIELIELHQMAQRQLAGSNDRFPTLPKGTYRPDVSDYLSIQYEFPDTYIVGDSSVPDRVTDLRKAQIKQLQAYLLFFDQLLGGYLKQLGEVRNLLSVNQNAEDATYFYHALYQVPGMRELLKDQVYEVTQEGVDALINQNVHSLITNRLGNRIGQVYIGINEFSDALEVLIGPFWRTFEDNILAAFGRSFVDDTEWDTYQHDPDNVYVQELQRIVETEDKRHRRKQHLLDHLLARFGETFTDYSIRIFESREAHLQAKIDFLGALPELGLEKPKGYHYRAKDPIEGDVDVWNTRNVAGLKKRIYRLLGWGEASTESVFVNPRYRLVEEEDRNKELPFRYLTLYRLDEANQPIEAFLTTAKSYSARKINQIKPGLFTKINNPDLYSLIQDAQTDQYQVQFQTSIRLGNGKDETVNLLSEKMTEKEATFLLEQVLELINVDLRPGFHIIEHILLRPNDPKDELLQMGFTCDIQFCPIDPYSFWISLVLPAWKGPFQDAEYRTYFMNLVRKETPAHIAVCFRWITEEDEMETFEYNLEQWREAFARCTPDECEVTDKANALVLQLNQLPCECFCFSPLPTPSKCD